MTDLEQLYRVAPKRTSPDSLDEQILRRAELHVVANAGTNKKPLLFSPWISLASCAVVVSFGIALVLRSGMVGINQPDSRLDGYPELQPLAETSDAGDEVLATADSSVGRSLAQSAQSQLRGEQDKLQSHAQSNLQSKLTPEPSPKSTPHTRQLAGEALASAELAPRSNRSDEHRPGVHRSDLHRPYEQRELTGRQSSPDAGTKRSLSNRTGILESAAETQMFEPADAVELVAEPLSAEPASRKILTNQRPVNEFLAETNSAFVQGSVVTGVNSVIWLNSQSSEGYTLQLATSNDDSYLTEFAIGLPVSRQLAVIAVQRPVADRSGPDSDGLYTLILGEFDSFESAQSALDRLPAEVRQFAARVRNFGVLQGMVR